MSPRPDRVLFGAAYYHEYQPSPRLETDLDLMVEANFSVIRVGESVWSTWEPEEGVFDLDWLQPVLDGAHARGIAVVLGTPTYAVPPWLARRHPEIAGEVQTGQRMPWGGRQEVDYSHPAFRFHAERVVRRIVERYAGHPAVIGFQVDNEPGLLLFHNEGVFQRFVDDLRQRYGTVEALNEAWGLVYWSHRLSTWADLWRPDGNYQPQYDLAWRTFQATLTTEFIAWQAGIVREYASPEQFVTTCIAYDRPGVDDVGLTRALDVTAGNPYYAMQDDLALPVGHDTPQGWTTSGAWTLFASADRMYASKQAPFLVTETNAGAIGGPATNFPAWDGQWRQAAWSLISRGAEMVEYWHWHTNHFGTESYWIGVLPHDQQPGRVYRELAALGAELADLGPTVTGLTPHASLGLVYSARSKWGLAFQSPFPARDAVLTPSDTDPRAFHRIYEAFYRGAFDAGVGVRVVHDEQLVERTPADVAAELPVLVVPGLLVADDALLTWLRGYAAAGGHLVLGIRTGYGDEEGRPRTEPKPALLADAAGVSFQEFSNLRTPLDVRSPGGELPVGPDAHATRWVDLLESDGAKTLLEYDHPQFGRFPAVTTTEHGEGRITTVGTVPDPALARDLAAWLVPDPRPGWGALPEPVTVSQARTRDGRRLHVVHNWGWEPQQVAAPAGAVDARHADRDLSGGLALGPWDVAVLLTDD
ncbi:beta-galactosidase [Friedmanniella luteola]|uniref:beta-galactosidase n=1 Tax=Friedmanniella luteola TaxID=546871 RepID=A0A1H1LJQ5_9ACTN|nr:beta-galactosidase [Friedmanniella luteola]SDR74746.1 beta-galactosidase [Friedmanniella luteola]